MGKVGAQKTASGCCQQQRNYWKTLPRNNGDISKETLRKLIGPALLHKDEENWRKPWCQVNEFEADQATSNVATETKLDQLFDWRQCSSFKQIRSFIVYCMTFGTKQNRPLKAEEIHLAEQNFVSICSTRKLPGCFEVQYKYQGNLKIIENYQIVSLSRGKWKN